MGDEVPTHLVRESVTGSARVRVEPSKVCTAGLGRVGIAKPT